jgi:hypothetical protein
MSASSEGEVDSRALLTTCIRNVSFLLRVRLDWEAWLGSGPAADLDAMACSIASARAHPDVLIQRRTATVVGEDGGAPLQIIDWLPKNIALSRNRCSDLKAKVKSSNEQDQMLSQAVDDVSQNRDRCSEKAAPIGISTTSGWTLFAERVISSTSGMIDKLGEDNALLAFKSNC